MKSIPLGKICEDPALCFDAALAKTLISAVSTDSRTVGPGALFVALKGDRFDGHDFVPQVLEAGAAAALVRGDRVDSLRRILPEADRKRLITTEDTLTALGQLAANFRKTLSVPVVGVTGSVGKTSTKDLTACALSPLGNVARTKLNFNNEIGLPLTVLSVEENDRALVGEMGMRGLGEIEYLTNILKPDVGIITNIGVSHIERLGSRENIMLAKTEICAGMTDGATLLVSTGDSVITREMILERVASFRKNIRVQFFGLTPDCDYWADSVTTAPDGSVSFVFHPGKLPVALRLAGTHNVTNALAALAAASLCGVSPEQAIPYVEAYGGDNVRQHIIQKNGMTVIDDTYNAGPESMCAALAVLGTLPGIRRRVAVLGSMLELGSASRQAHQDVCRAAEENGVDWLITVGDTWGQSLPVCRVKEKTHCATWEDVLTVCGDRLGLSGDGILVKGSHAMHLDHIVNALIKGENENL